MFSLTEGKLYGALKTQLAKSRLSVQTILYKMYLESHQRTCGLEESTNGFTNKPLEERNGHPCAIPSDLKPGSSPDKKPNSRRWDRKITLRILQTWLLALTTTEYAF